MAVDWRTQPPPPTTLGEFYLQPTGKNQRSRARIRRQWLSARPPYRDWAGLDPDILTLIFHKLNAFSILWPAQAVCRSWRQAALEPHVWRRIDMRNPLVHMYEAELEKIAREAVDRNGGRVEEFFAEGFGSDELLSYIAERSTGLRSLVLISTYKISANGLAKFVGRFPEVLEISNYNFYDASLLKKMAGFSLSGLKRFCLNQLRGRKIRKYREYYDYSDDSDDNYVNDDEVALLIAKCMPRDLHELELVGNMMTDKGLNAILEKCPDLEYLDIRRCWDVKGKIKTKIKTVRLPAEPLEESELSWKPGQSRISDCYCPVCYFCCLRNYDYSDDSDDNFGSCDDYDFCISASVRSNWRKQRYLARPWTNLCSSSWVRSYCW